MPAYTAYDNELDYDIACELEKCESQEEYDEISKYLGDVKNIAEARIF